MLYLIAVLVPIAGGILLAASKKLKTEERYQKPCFAGLMLLCDALALLAGFCPTSEVTLTLTGGARLLFSVDPFGRFALLIIVILYTAVCFYGFSYLEDDKRRTSFYAIFFCSFGALLAVSFAATLVTLYACFETATLMSMPLVCHERTKPAVEAAKKYLYYSIGGALMGLCAILVVTFYAETDRFVYGGFLTAEAVEKAGPFFFVALFLGIVGFGTKAGIYPMHGWLPTAHPIAPAPASALLSGIIAKSGVIALVRLVYFAVGPSLLAGTTLQKAWLVLCMITVVLGSSMAFLEPVLKKRLAYSTVSQLSYILLGLALLSEEGLYGGMLQMLSHAMAKGCLFLCAGVIIHKAGLHDVKELRGIGKRLPVTMWCFLIASLSLIGIPPMGGFLAKWQLTAASLAAEGGLWSYLPPIVLLISAMLTAGYLLPVVIGGFFPGKEEGEGTSWERIEEPLVMTVPMLLLCTVALFAGVFGVLLPLLFPM